MSTATIVYSIIYNVLWGCESQGVIELLSPLFDEFKDIQNNESPRIVVKNSLSRVYFCCFIYYFVCHKSYWDLNTCRLEGLLYVIRCGGWPWLSLFCYSVPRWIQTGWNQMKPDASGCNRMQGWTGFLLQQSAGPNFKELLSSRFFYCTIYISYRC